MCFEFSCVQMMDSLYEDRTPDNMKLLKRNMTLDFNSPTSNSKKAKLMKTCILESPDLKMLKLASPELERMIIAQNGFVTTTPTPSGIPQYFLKHESEVTEEQELYARGFVDALNQLHQTNGYQEQQQQHNGINNNHNQNQNNNHQNNNNSHQQNNHSNNHNINSQSSDSSSDLTIADHNSSNNCNNNNNRLNSNRYISTSNSSTNNFSSLIPTSVATTAVTTFASNKFAIPSIPPQEQYVNISQTNGGEVIVNNTSVLPPYSAAVNHNPIYPMTIKMEPQKPSNTQSMPSSARGLTPPLSPQQHMAPIDMADQERIKLERKRLRNRIAASKCRRRKLERISRLEDKVKGLKGENSELSVVVNKLRDQVCSLKQQVMDHVKCGCQLMVPQ